MYCFLVENMWEITDSKINIIISHSKCQLHKFQLVVWLLVIILIETVFPLETGSKIHEGVSNILLLKFSCDISIFDQMVCDHFADKVLKVMFLYESCYILI